MSLKSTDIASGLLVLLLLLIFSAAGWGFWKKKRNDAAELELRLNTIEARVAKNMEKCNATQ